MKIVHLKNRLVVLFFVNIVIKFAVGNLYGIPTLKILPYYILISTKNTQSTKISVKSFLFIKYNKQ